MGWQIASWIVAFGVGLALGVAYFGALWLSVRHLPQTKRPALLLAASALVRFTLLAAAFVLVMDTGWERLLVCILGFLVGRHVLIRRIAGSVRESG